MKTKKKNVFCIPPDTRQGKVGALGGCHASVHIHPEGRFEEAGGSLMVVTSGGDTLSCLFHVLSFLLEDADLCVYHRAVLSVTDALL